MNSGYTFRDRIGAADTGRTVLDYYVGKWSRHHDREGWRACILQGLVTREGRALRPEDRLQAGDVLEYHRPPWEEPPGPSTFTVLFSDDDIMVFDKPAGLPVTPGAGCQDRTLLSLARALHDPGLSPVHRLDVGTSGVVVFGRNASACRRLCAAFQERRVEKSYLARVTGRVGPDAFAIDVPIGPVPYPPLGQVSGACERGRPARTAVRVVRRGENETLVEARPITGRSQQVRIHLAVSGHPIVGDPMYVAGGSPVSWREGDSIVRPGDCGYLLHAWRIRFPHPRDGRFEEVEAPPPGWANQP